MLAYFLTFVFLWIPMTPPTASLTVEITNLRNTGGQLRVALYKPTDKFSTAKPDFYEIVSIDRPGSRRVVFDVPPGTYAVAVYHDLNNNNKLDKNLVGYPKEPFGFSNNYRPVLSAPDFEDCAFKLPSQGASLTIKLID